MINCYQSDVRKLGDEDLAGLIAELEQCVDIDYRYANWSTWERQASERLEGMYAEQRWRRELSGQSARVAARERAMAPEVEKALKADGAKIFGGSDARTF